MVTDYDSDSTEGDYTETNVLLGYASRDADQDTISKLGGRPVRAAHSSSSVVVVQGSQTGTQDWLEADAPPSAALARCRACGDLMALLLQLNGELPERFPGHERRLYVFACRRPTCRRKDGSVRALRGLRVWAEEEAQKAQQSTPKTQQQTGPEEMAKSPVEEATRTTGGLGEALFGADMATGGQNPFSTNVNPFSSAPPPPPPASPFAASLTPSNHNVPSAPEKEATEPSLPTLTKTFAESLSLDAAAPAPAQPAVAEPWPAAAQQPAPYPTSYLSDADYETLDATPAPVPAQARLEAADAAEPSALDREAFESAMDATFQSFADRLAQNPDQVIRYEFAGAPLLYSKTDAVGHRFTTAAEAPDRAMPACPVCAGPRVFEVQLTPRAIAELEAGDLSLEGMDWGTVIVGVCTHDCLPRHGAPGDAAYLEEWVGVQWEELAKQK